MFTTKVVELSATITVIAFNIITINTAAIIKARSTNTYLVIVT